MIDWSFVATTLGRLATQALPGRLLSVSLPLPRRPATRWLDTGVAWQRPAQDVQLSACGVAFATTSNGPGRFAALHAAQRGLLQSWLCNDPALPVAFTGFAFAPEGGDPLPNARLWVPELLLREERGTATLTLTTPAEHAAAALARWQAQWRTWTQPVAVSPAPTFSVKRLTCRPQPLAFQQPGVARGRRCGVSSQPNPLADRAFLARGRAALRAIASGEFDKLVLTRGIELRADDGIAPAPLLARLAERHPNCATFGVACGSRAFVGASPETLLSLSGREVCVDALAGTAWRTAARALGDEKNRREHDIVARAIANGLTAFCSAIVLPDAPEVMHLNGLAHLRRRIRARRNDAVSAYDLIARLHPTPAVGGTPTSAALDWLKRHGDRRGAWYTGGIGWLDARGNADIAVALRCGLIETNRIALYAGAGFVSGSEPEQELAETEAKLAALRDVLMADPATSRIAA